MKEDIFKLSKYNYHLPQTLIAQEPLGIRDNSRLLIIRFKTVGLSLNKNRLYKLSVDYYYRYY